MTAAEERRPRLAKYELLEEVGHGGMATVYRAVDRRLGREVAVKVIHPHLRENKEVAARFVSEARAVAKLKHANIVEVYDVSDEAEDDRYLIVELVKGRTLRELLRAQRFLPPEVAAVIGLEVAAGLEHAHRLGVVHRDVKPENVLIAEPHGLRGRRVETRENPEAAVKIADFGIAKLLDAQGVTATGQVLGSPAHMAPEQIEGGEVSARSDVFGVGVLLYECMVGRLPFEGSNPAQVLRRVLEGVFTSPERCRPTIGAAYGGILSRALAHRPEDRFATAGELAGALREQLELLGFGSPREELTAFLADPTEYRAGHQERVVERLAEVASELRAAGEVQQAAALFNRALAYRPDDPELLSAVMGIARAERMRRALRRAAVGSAAVGLLVGAGWGLSALMANASGEASSVPVDEEAAGVDPGRATAEAPGRAPERRSAPQGTAPDEPPPGDEGAEPGSSERKDAPRSSVPVKAANPRARSGSRAPIPAETAPATRKVRVHISGAGGGKLKIDGVPRDWFGVEHELTEGQHTIEFIPPNEQCCVAPPPRVITVAPGSGPQQIHGHIEFRDGVVRLSGPPGSVLRCGELFPGELAAPGQRSVSMNRPVVEATCTLIAPAETGLPPKPIDVTLRPGGVFNIAGS